MFQTGTCNEEILNQDKETGVFERLHAFFLSGFDN